MLCKANSVSPSMGSQQVQAPYPQGAVGDRVNDKPVNLGHRPAPHGPSMLVNPSSPAKSARRAWHALPPFCCSQPGMKMESEPPGQLMPFPYKPHSGRVINGDEPELSSWKEVQHSGCNQLTSALPRRHMANDHWTHEEGKSSSEGSIFAS